MCYTTLHDLQGNCAQRFVASPTPLQRGRGCRLGHAVAASHLGEDVDRVVAVVVQPRSECAHVGAQRLGAWAPVALVQVAVGEEPTGAASPRVVEIGVAGRVHLRGGGGSSAASLGQSRAGTPKMPWSRSLMRRSSAARTGSPCSWGSRGGRTAAPWGAPTAVPALREVGRLRRAPGQVLPLGSPGMGGSGVVACSSVLDIDVLDVRLRIVHRREVDQDSAGTTCGPQVGPQLRFGGLGYRRQGLQLDNHLA